MGLKKLDEDFDVETVGRFDGTGKIRLVTREAGSFLLVQSFFCTSVLIIIDNINTDLFI